MNYTFKCSKCGLYNQPGSKFCQQCGGRVIDLWARKIDIGYKGFVVMFSIIMIMLVLTGVVMTVLSLLH